MFGDFEWTELVKFRPGLLRAYLLLRAHPARRFQYLHPLTGVQLWFQLSLQGLVWAYQYRQRVHGRAHPRLLALLGPAGTKAKPAAR